jgi:hypothetical protein
LIALLLLLRKSIAPRFCRCVDLRLVGNAFFVGLGENNLHCLENLHLSHLEISVSDFGIKLLLESLAEA